MSDDEYKKVTFRNRRGKYHYGLWNESKKLLVAACRCPGSQNGSLFKNAVIISEGWANANCGGRLDVENNHPELFAKK
jgi:hypothetical protein